jgi:predicted mannosyl-3-phosphoglycerate phosphatase (HAD superfamily)
VQTLREKGFLIRGFGDMTVEEVAGITGLSLFEAQMAKKRDFDEPFVFEAAEGRSEELFLEIGRMGFHFTQGIFHHILGNSDKGRAVEVLMDLYRKTRRGLRSIALGDSPNDFPMLAKADVPVLVQRANGRHAAGVAVPNIVLQEGIGPKGWGKAISRILADIGQ